MAFFHKPKGIRNHQNFPKQVTFPCFGSLFYWENPSPSNKGQRKTAFPSGTNEGTSQQAPPAYLSNSQRLDPLSKRHLENALHRKQEASDGTSGGFFVDLVVFLPEKRKTRQFWQCSSTPRKRKHVLGWVVVVVWCSC